LAVEVIFRQAIRSTFHRFPDRSPTLNSSQMAGQLLQ
jgi:hypothetical protein